MDQPVIGDVPVELPGGVSEFLSDIKLALEVLLGQVGENTENKAVTEARLTEILTETLKGYQTI